MTLREVYEAVLIEQNKRKAPSILLEDFNYFYKKATYNYLETRYIAYDKDQKSVDDLGAVKEVNYPIFLSKQGKYYTGALPSDYLHILNCSVDFIALSDFSCYEKDQVFNKSANRLPSGAATNVESNYYFRPSFKKSYFYSNGSLLEIRSGNTTILKPSKAYIDYIKNPKSIVLTEEQVESVEDTSEELEFSEMVCLQIINELVKLLLENASDPRLQTNIPVNQTVPLNR